MLQSMHYVRNKNCVVVEVQHVISNGNCHELMHDLLRNHVTTYYIYVDYKLHQPPSYTPQYLFLHNQ